MGGAGSDNLTVDGIDPGSSIPDILVDSASLVVRRGGAVASLVHYGSIEALSLNLGSNGSHVSLLDTIAGPVTITGGLADDELDVYAVHGPVMFDGAAGAAERG